MQNDNEYGDYRESNFRARVAESGGGGNESIFYRVGSAIARRMYDSRRDEYRATRKHFENATRILDVGCGTGSFMTQWPDACEGIDLNPDNVKMPGPGAQGAGGKCFRASLR